MYGVDGEAVVIIEASAPPVLGVLPEKALQADLTTTSLVLSTAVVVVVGATGTRLLSVEVDHIEKGMVHVLHLPLHSLQSLVRLSVGFRLLGPER